jgi:hypothetical protein
MIARLRRRNLSAPRRLGAAARDFRAASASTRPPRAYEELGDVLYQMQR